MKIISKIAIFTFAALGLLFLAGCNGDNGCFGGCFSCLHHKRVGVKGYATGKNTPTGPVTSQHHWNR